MFYISADLKLRWVRGREVVTPVISFEFESLRYNDVSILFLCDDFHPTRGSVERNPLVLVYRWAVSRFLEV